MAKNLLHCETGFGVYRSTSGGSSGEATEAGPHPHLSMNLNKHLFLRIRLSHLHPAARQFCRSTYTITDNTIK
jgi:hypothetical protein